MSRCAGVLKAGQLRVPWRGNTVPHRGECIDSDPVHYRVAAPLEKGNAGDKKKNVHQCNIM